MTHNNTPDPDDPFGEMEDADDTVFGEEDDGDATTEEWETVGEIDPDPIGVLLFFVKNAKRLPTKNGEQILLELQVDQAPYQKSEPVQLWFGSGSKAQSRLFSIARTLLGANNVKKVALPGGKSEVRLRKPGLEAFKNKTGMGIFVDHYSGTGSELASWLPKAGDKEQWDAYLARSKFSDEQLKALKSADGGVLHPSQHELFED